MFHVTIGLFGKRWVVPEPCIYEIDKKNKSVYISSSDEWHEELKHEAYKLTDGHWISTTLRPWQQKITDPRDLHDSPYSRQFPNVRIHDSSTTHIMFQGTDLLVIDGDYFHRSERLYIKQSGNWVPTTETELIENKHPEYLVWCNFQD